MKRGGYLGAPPPKGGIVGVSKPAAPANDAGPGIADARLSRDSRVHWPTVLGLLLGTVAYLAWIVYYVAVLMPWLDDWGRQALGFGFGKFHVLPLVGTSVLAMMGIGWGAELIGRIARRRQAR